MLEMIRSDLLKTFQKQPTWLTKDQAKRTESLMYLTSPSHDWRHG